MALLIILILSPNLHKKCHLSQWRIQGGGGGKWAMPPPPPPLSGEPQFFFFRCWAVRSHVRACKMSDRACHMHARRLRVGLRDLLHVSGSAEAWQTVETLKMRKIAYFDSWISKFSGGACPPTPLGSSGFARGQPRGSCIHIHFYNLPLQPLLAPPPPLFKILDPPLCLMQGRFPWGSAFIAKWTRRQSRTVEENTTFLQAQKQAACVDL